MGGLTLPLFAFSYAASLQNLIFRFFTNKSRVQLWLYEQPDLRIEGRIMVSIYTLFCSAALYVCRYVYQLRV